MNGIVHEDEVGVSGAQAADGMEPATCGTIVKDPEHAAGAAVGTVLHDLLDEAVAGSDAGLGRAMPEQLDKVDVENIGYVLAPRSRLPSVGTPPALPGEGTQPLPFLDSAGPEAEPPSAVSANGSDR